MNDTLSQFTWAYQTNITKGLLAPEDAVILLLKDGELSQRHLIGALRTWRLDAHNNFFDPCCYYVANSILGDPPPNCYRPKDCDIVEAYWYKTKQARWALTIAGIKRLHELGF